MSELEAFAFQLLEENPISVKSWLFWPVSKLVFCPHSLRPAQVAYNSMLFEELSLSGRLQCLTRIFCNRSREERHRRIPSIGGYSYTIHQGEHPHILSMMNAFFIFGSQC
uniref:Uncharacterized protein n=1 Tax=Ditylenchus dipsaci TaxID=166011 RepID=A0A915DIF1_9BILA